MPTSEQYKLVKKIMIGYNRKKGCSRLYFQINASPNDMSVHNSTRKMKESMQCEFGCKYKGHWNLHFV